MARKARKNPLKKFYVFTVVVTVLFIAYVVFKIPGSYLGTTHVNGVSSTKAVFYYSPPCGCCDIYLPKLKSILAVEVKAMSPGELEGIKKGLGIPKGLWSCHTVVIGGKYVEGHVPISAVVALLEGGFQGARGLALPHEETDPKRWEGPGYYVVYENGTVWRVYS